MPIRPLYRSGLLKQRLSRENVINRSGFEINSQSALPPLRKGYYYVVDQAIAGDAPKNFIRAYTYGMGKRSNPRKWPAYIAKVGHKWYPNESITEHLLTRIGQLLGLQMAESSLVSVHGQVRFLSRYFLGRNQKLVHGAEIFGGYLEDESFVEKVEKAGATRDLFTFQVVAEAIQEHFSDQVARSILNEYTRMLAFDAIVGNNDRHHYNWGIVVHEQREHDPYFSPVYDNARALFWNDSESKLKAIKRDPDPNRLPTFLKRYIENSRPKTGWDGEKNLNHFALIQKIHRAYPALRPALEALCHPQLLQRVQETLDDEFSLLMSPLRREMILTCLKHRLELMTVSDTSTEESP